MIEHCPCEPDTWTWPDAYGDPMDEPNIRVFTQAFRDSADIEGVKDTLSRRAERMGLVPSRDGTFCANYHPTAKLFVMVLTVVPPTEREIAS